MQTYKISRSTAVLITFLMMIGLAILASSCAENTIEQPEITTINYPYEWDSIKYSRIISHVNGVSTPYYYDMTVNFNEEFIEIVCPNSLGDEPIIFIGRWNNDCSFTIDDNVGRIVINPKTGVMTIIYSNGAKEIYTN